MMSKSWCQKFSIIDHPYCWIVNHHQVIVDQRQPQQDISIRTPPKNAFWRTVEGNACESGKLPHFKLASETGANRSLMVYRPILCHFRYSSTSCAQVPLKLALVTVIMFRSRALRFGCCVQ